MSGRCQLTTHTYNTLMLIDHVIRTHTHAYRVMHDAYEMRNTHMTYVTRDTHTHAYRVMHAAHGMRYTHASYRSRHTNTYPCLSCYARSLWDALYTHVL